MNTENKEIDKAELFYQQGKAQLENNNNFVAIALLTQALMADSNHINARILRASLLVKMNSIKEAEKDIDYLTGIENITLKQIMEIGQLCIATNNIEKAITIYNRAKDYDKSEHIYIMLTRLYVVNRQLDKALDTINSLIEQKPDCGAAYKERGSIKLKLNDKAGAMDDLKNAIKLDPKEMELLEGKLSNCDKELKDITKEQQPYRI